MTRCLNVSRACPAEKTNTDISKSSAPTRSG